MRSARVLFAVAALSLPLKAASQQECHDANTQCASFLSNGVPCTQELAGGVLLSDQCQLSCGVCTPSDDGTAAQGADSAPAPPVPDPDCRDSMSNCESLLTAGYPCSFEPVPGQTLQQYCPLSCGVCGGRGCAPNSIEDCAGHCVPVAYVGDGVCDNEPGADLNCDAGQWDGGDCGECGDAVGVLVTISVATYGNEIRWRMDDAGLTYGNYLDNQQAVRGMCLESGVDHFLNATDTLNDGWHGGWFSVRVRESDRYLVHPTLVQGSGLVAEFSTEIDCTAQQVISCSGGCVPAFYVGDGTCDDRTRPRDWDLECAENSFDGGDCLCKSFDPEACGCAPEEIVSCEMECAPRGFIGDGVCDGPSAYRGHDLNCPENSNDGGDCEDFCYSTTIVDRATHETILNAAQATEELILGDDEMSLPIEFGFDFPFYRQQYRALRVSSNGFVAFDYQSEHGCCEGRELPDQDFGSLISPYWEDIDPTSGGTVLYGSNSDTFILRFDAVPHAERPRGGDTTWNLILHRDGTFFLDFEHAVGDGGMHTVGWQELGATQYQMLCHGSGSTTCQYSDITLEVSHEPRHARDACGVCEGDGSACLGCDGVPHSGLVEDECGECGGDGSACGGCRDERAENFDPAATQDFWWLCEYEGGCPEGEALSCDGSMCSGTQYIGDGLCDGADMVFGVNMNCSQHNFDGGDCLGCDDLHVTTCDGQCVSNIAWGDGYCDDAATAALRGSAGFVLDCEELDYDHGDCSDNCPDGQIESCSGECTSVLYHGDGVCDDEAASTGVHFNCERLWYDLGDCEQQGQCASHEDCAAWQTTGPMYCNAQTSCQECRHISTAMCDVLGGDCCSADFIMHCGDRAGCDNVPTCEDHEVVSCANLCAPEIFIGDGVCDGDRIGSHHLDCEEFGWDGGDCLCGDDMVRSCTGSCAPAEYLGDGICDGDDVFGGHHLNCSALMYDEGDCTGRCPERQIVGCLDECIPASWLGNGVCDHEGYRGTQSADCDALNWDGGDCVHGCTDPTADNFVRNANIDDGSCQRLGCTDPAADNYDPMATVNDNSCILEACLEPTACNYNPSATHACPRDPRRPESDCCRYEIPETCDGRRTTCQELFGQECPCDVYEPRNTIEYNGFIYATLDDMRPSVGGYGGTSLDGQRCPMDEPDCQGSTCSWGRAGQNYYLRLPCGWDLFPILHSCHHHIWENIVPQAWGTRCIVDIFSQVPLYSIGPQAGMQGNEVDWGRDGNVHSVAHECGDQGSGFVSSNSARNRVWSSRYATFSPHDGFQAADCGMRFLIRKPTDCEYTHVGCDGVDNSGMALDECGVCGGDGTLCADVCGVPYGDASTCQDCAGVPNGLSHVDVCGDCDDNPANDGDKCVGCDGVAYSGVVEDQCGICGGDGHQCAMCIDRPECPQWMAAGYPCTLVLNNVELRHLCPVECDHDACGCNGLGYEFGGLREDECGVCGGDSSTCIGCDGVPLADGGLILDVCGVCGGNGDSCIGCDGIANSGLNWDVCGVCDGHGVSCTGCDGIINSGLVRDECGVCAGDNTRCAGCDGVPNSGARVDECGVCAGDSTQCAGCDGVPNSGTLVDECGVCGGSSACLTSTPTCDAGTEIQDGANCVDCAPGQADEDTDPNTPCTACRAGKYADTAKATVCLSCAPGTITDGATACVACSPGQYAAGEGSSCLDCEAGRADTDLSASTPCVTCQAGTYSMDATTCESCPAGKKSNDAGTRCDDCFAGRASAAGAHVCTHCEPGRAASVGSSECTQCPAGTFAAASAAICNVCAEGYEDRDSDPTTLCTLQRDAQACDLGTYTATQDGANCVDCAPGQADEDTDPNTPCTACRAGKYADTAKATVCLSCAPGTITDGATACVACSPGQYAAGEGSSCLDCEAGRADTDLSASTPCVTCQAGTYSMDATTCESCPAGKKSNDAGTRCDDCFAGRASAAGAHVCTHCEPGRAASVGSSECTQCPAGTFAWESAAACSVCEEGYEDADSDPTTLCTRVSSVVDDQTSVEEAESTAVLAIAVVLVLGSAGLAVGMRGKLKTPGQQLPTNEKTDISYIDGETENPVHEDESNNPVHEDQLAELGLQEFDVEEANSKAHGQPMPSSEKTDDYFQKDENDNPLYESEDEGANPIHEDRLGELDTGMREFSAAEANSKASGQPVPSSERPDDYDRNDDENDNPLYEDEGANPIHEDQLDEVDSAMEAFDVEETHI